MVVTYKRPAAKLPVFCCELSENWYPSGAMENTDITGHLILLMAPTGSGKGVLERHIFATFPEIVFSVSCTTRAPRPGEQDGVNYYFIDREEFQRRIDRDEFLEWAEFGGNLYGTLKSEIIERLKSGEVILNEIELQGVEALQKLIPKEHLTIIYVDAGGWDILKKRAEARAPISEEELALRHERFLVEREWKKSADYVIQNQEGHVEEAKQQFAQIVENILANTKTSNE